MSGEGWFCFAAVRWVIEDSGAPARLWPVLLILAKHADPDGTGAYPSAGVIADQLTGKAQRQVQRDIAELEFLELIVRGDQRKVQRLPKWQRPVVYDLPIHKTAGRTLRHQRRMSNGDEPDNRRSDPTTSTSYESDLSYDIDGATLRHPRRTSRTPTQGRGWVGAVAPTSPGRSSSKSKDGVDYKPGDRVEHRIYGAGCVLTVEDFGADGPAAQIDFGSDCGVKDLVLAYAPITKVGAA